MSYYVETIFICIIFAILSSVTADIVRDKALGIHVSCNAQSMDMVLQRQHYPDLDPRTFQLKGDKTNPRCGVTFYNSTIIVIKAPLGRCGTQARLEREGRMLGFKNQVLADILDTSGGSTIVREPAYEFHLHCLYYRKAKLSLPSFRARDKVVIVPPTEYGNFTFEINMFQTDKYLSPFQSFPVKVHVGERIHLQVKVETNASNLTLLLENCRATPSRDPNDTIVQELIKDGCPIDQSLNYKASESGYQRFSLKAFRFFGAEEVFLHCEVVVCRKDNAASRCAEGCRQQPGSEEKRRKKRSETSVGKDIATLGPVRILLDRLNLPLPPKEGEIRSAASALFQLPQATLLTLTLAWLTTVV